jgi:hypothetical protein
MAAPPEALESDSATFELIILSGQITPISAKKKKKKIYIASMQYDVNLKSMY